MNISQIIRRESILIISRKYNHIIFQEYRYFCVKFRDELINCLIKFYYRRVLICYSSIKWNVFLTACLK